MKRNFGMPHPEGYRKALRIYELASRFGLPIITLVDTPGAYPGIGAEERGQSEAIGACLAAMARARVPIVTTIIGEGGSGGALALAVANQVLVLEYGTYSVITPEGCASILWKDAAKADEAAATHEDDGARTCCVSGWSIASSRSRRAAPTRTTISRRTARRSRHRSTRSASSSPAAVRRSSSRRGIAASGRWAPWWRKPLPAFYSLRECCSR